MSDLTLVCISAKQAPGKSRAGDKEKEEEGYPLHCARGRLRAQMARAVRQSKMAANVFRPHLRDWGCCLRWSYALRQLSQTQGPPDNPSFVESVDEYQFVERLFPPTKIPEPPKHKHYPTPSGWQPPRDPPPNLPYFVRRSRMHNIPVYKDITHGNRQMTVIRKVEGNIWALQKDVEEFLSPQLGRTPITQVNEVTGTLRIKGYFDEQLKAWLLEKGF